MLVRRNLLIKLFSAEFLSSLNSVTYLHLYSLSVGEDILLSKRDDDVDWRSGEGKDVNLVSELLSTPKPCANLLTLDDKNVSAISSSQRMANKPSVGNEISMEPPDIESKMGGALQSSSSPEFRTPLRNLTNSSCSKDWQMSSQKKSASNERPLRLKRLCRIGDISRGRRQSHIKKSACVEVAFDVTDVHPNVMKHTKGTLYYLCVTLANIALLSHHKL